MPLESVRPSYTGKSWPTPRMKLVLPVRAGGLSFTLLNRRMRSNYFSKKKLSAQADRYLTCRYTNRRTIEPAALSWVNDSKITLMRQSYFDFSDSELKQAVFQALRSPAESQTSMQSVAFSLHERQATAQFGKADSSDAYNCDFPESCTRKDICDHGPDGLRTLTFKRTARRLWLMSCKLKRANPARMAKATKTYFGTISLHLFNSQLRKAP